MDSLVNVGQDLGETCLRGSANNKGHLCSLISTIVKRLLEVSNLTSHKETQGSSKLAELY